MIKLRMFVWSTSLLLSVLTGCSGTTVYMRPAAPANQRLTPTPSDAVLVLLRPGGYGVGIVTNISDEHGNFIGQLRDAQRMSVRMKPGSHFLVIWGSSIMGTATTDGRGFALQLEPGKTYYARVTVWPGGSELNALATRTKTWPERDTWFESCEPQEADLAAAQTGRDLDELADKLEDAREEWSEWTAEQRAARSLVPTDGV